MKALLRLFQSPERLIVIVGLTGLAGFFWWYSVAMNEVFYNYSSDTGNMWQSMWNLAHGHGYVYTHPGTGLTTNRLGTHADLLLVLLSPLTWFFRSPNILYGVQAAGLAFGGWWLWRIAERLWHRPALSLALVGAYALYGPLQFSALWQFHTYTLLVPLLLATVEAIVARRRLWLVWLWFSLALLLKEHVGFLIGPTIALVWWWAGRRRLAWLSLVVGVGYAAAAFFVLIPLARPEASSHFAWNDLYGDVGSTLGQQLAAIAQPDEFFRRIFTSTHAIATIQLLLPLAFLAVLSPLTLIAAAGIIPMWLSRVPINHTATYIAHLGSAAVLLVGMGHGIERLRRRWPAWWAKSHLVILIWSGALLGSFIASPMPWSMWYQPLMMKHDPSLQRFVAAAAERIPVDASIGQNRELGPFLRGRLLTYPLLKSFSTASYIVIHEPLVFAGTVRASRQVYQPVRNYLDQSPAWRLIYVGDNGFIYERNWGIDPAPFTP